MTDSAWILRAATADDADAIDNITRRAFNGDIEAKLIKSLTRNNCYDPQLSIVAVDKESNNIIGHCLFSYVTILDNDQSRTQLALAPVSVDPLYQGRGVGSDLIRHGVQIAKQLEYTIILVLGHVEFYTRLGFSVEMGKRVQCEYNGEHFMAMELKQGALPSSHLLRAEYTQPFKDLG